MIVQVKKLSISDLLRRIPPTWSLRYIMDRIHTSFPPLFHRDMVRSRNRRRILSNHIYHRNNIPSRRSIFDFFMYRILASIPSTRSLHGYRKWIIILSHISINSHILFQKPSRSCRVSGFRNYNGRNDNSRNCGGTSPSRRIRMDCSCVRIFVYGLSNHLSCDFED